jgi:putative ABC transport system permease protein
VISYDYWQRRFGRDPKVIGRTFRMRDNLYQIVGVGPRGFTGTEPGTVTDIFAPTKMEPTMLFDYALVLRIFVRVLPGVEVRALADKLNAAYQQWEDVRLKNFPKNLLAPNATLSLKPAGTGASLMQNEYAQALTVLGVLVALVLLIACANVANLMAGQAAARTREMALRISLGSGRARLVRLVMVESAMLGVLAAALGLAFAWWATPYVVGRINPPDDPARLVLGVDWMVAAFAVLLTLAVTALFGMLPALRASAVHPLGALKGGEKPRSKASWMQSMIAMQVAFCFVVLFLAGLFVATEATLAHRPMGFTPERLLLLDTVTKQPQPAVKWDQMAAALRNVPGVQSTALEDWPLLSGSQHNNQISLHGDPPGPTIAFFLAVSPSWLDTMRIPLVDGRDFRNSDVSPSVAIVNETFAKTFFDGQNPVGQGFDVPQPFDAQMKKPKTHYEIVGVVKDVLYRKVREQISPQVYLPLHHVATAAGAPAGTSAGAATGATSGTAAGKSAEARARTHTGATAGTSAKPAADTSAGALETMRGEVIAVRTTSDDAGQMAEVLRRTVTQTDPEFRVSTITAQTELIADQTIRERLLAALAGFFAVVALLLAAVGLYGQQTSRESSARKSSQW